MKKFIGILILFFVIASSLMSRTGFYTSMINSVKSYEYLNKNISKLDEVYSKKNFILEGVIYRINFFELYMEYRNEKNFNDESINSVVLGFGKIFTIIKGKRIEPNIITGVYASLSPYKEVDENENQKSELKYEYGIYVGFRVRIKTFKSKKSFLKSIDLGYKYMIPVYDNYYEGRRILSDVHSFYIGVSI